jgi:hypothetical protein
MMFKICVSVLMLENVNVGEIWGLYSLDYSQVNCAQKNWSETKLPTASSALNRVTSSIALKNKQTNKQSAVKNERPIHLG